MSRIINLLAVAAITACTAPSWAADPPPELIRQAAATAGGNIVMESALFDSTNNDFLHGFNDRFGKDGLHVKVVRLQSMPQIQLYDQETRAGKVSVDLMFFSDPSGFTKMAQAHKWTPYCSANFKDFRPDAVSPDCSFFHTISYVQYIAYNTDLVHDKITSWMDLTDPKWKGKVALLDPRVGGGIYYFYYEMFKLFGKEWFIKAHANDPLLAQSFGTTENQVMSGERLLGATHSDLTRVDGHFPGGKNAPIGEAFPKEGMALVPNDIAITVGGPNLAGAKVFIDWASSLEGQRYLAHNGLFSLRKDFTSREGDDLSKIHYLTFDLPDVDARRAEYTKLAEDLLSGKQ